MEQQIKEIPGNSVVTNTWHIAAAGPYLLQACIEALWALENGEAEAQKQGRPRLAERKELLQVAINKALNL